MHSIYKITNIKTNKEYVGQTSKSIDERFSAHIKCAKRKVNRYLYDSMNYHGYDNFKIELIESVETKIEADEREKFWIDSLTTLYPAGYNMTSGGGGGYTLVAYSDEEKKVLYDKQKESRKWYSHSEETRNKISESKTGQFLSDEHKKNISETLKEKYKTGEIKPVLPPIVYGENHHGWVEMDEKNLLIMIKDGSTINGLCEYFNCSRPTVINRIKLYFNKTYTELRKEYGITHRKKTLE